jgi:hypothetical protein
LPNLAETLVRSNCRKNQKKNPEKKKKKKKNPTVSAHEHAELHDAEAELVGFSSLPC